ncbi:MAG: hypothetical protein Q9163_002286 [Psora crenata]
MVRRGLPLKCEEGICRRRPASLWVHMTRLSPSQLDCSIAPDPTAFQEENDSTFPAFEELLRGAGEAEDPQHAVSSVGHGTGWADGSAEHPTPIDCDDPLTAETKETETSAERPTAAAVFVPTATAPQLKSKGGSRVPSIPYQFRCKAQSWVRPLQPSLAVFNANRGLQPRAPTLREKPNYLGSASCPPPPPPPPAGTVPSPMTDAQTESSVGSLKDIGLGPSEEFGGGKERADIGEERNGDGDKRDEDWTATRAPCLRREPADIFKNQKPRTYVFGSDCLGTNYD